MTRMESGIRIGTTEERIVEPVGTNDPDRGLHVRIRGEETKQLSACLEDLFVRQGEHDLCLPARDPGSKDLGLAVDFVETADDFVPVTR